MSVVHNAGDEVLGKLRALALDLHWSWDHASDALWRRIDPELWTQTRNPWLILDTASGERIAALGTDVDLAALIDTLISDKRRRDRAPTWFSETHPTSPLRTVAYFSMEFMLAEALPIYSGGLGNVAGDQLKAASDLGVPVVGVGLLYAQGYFRQALRSDGTQEALYPVNDPGQLPLRPLRDTNGEWLRIRLDWPGMKLTLRTWEVQVGRRMLYLLDTNDPTNSPAQRCITSELYGGGPETRLAQEIVLGIGGWRLLRAIGIAPEICHLNEGHAAFAALERAAEFLCDNDCSFAEALTATRAGNVFTTHTAVEAGFDRFDPALIRRRLGRYGEQALGISPDALLALGRRDPADPGEPFNMATLAIHASAAVSAVSALHGQVSRRLFQPLFPRWPAPEVPVGHVTNGIHVPSWSSKAADRLWTPPAGKDRWRGDLDGINAVIQAVDDDALWQLRGGMRANLVADVRRRHARVMADAGGDEHEVAEAARVFDPAALTLGFARRFATYKRPNLLLHDPERLARLLLDRERPVQLVLAGKAHPADAGGQALVAEWNAFARRPELGSHVVFLPDYDMLMAETLVQGVDLWINTPRRPWEACGTSGMKTLANGGLNLSSLDGWWAEAYTPEVGWAIGDGREHGDDPAIDAAEAETLYTLLEREIVPEFYNRGAARLPVRWIARVRESVARLAPRFSANRAVRDYTETLYLPGAASYGARAADRGRLARELARGLAKAAFSWDAVHFGTVDRCTEGGARTVRAELFLAGLEPDMVDVALYAETDEQGGAPFCVPMTLMASDVTASGAYLFGATTPATRPGEDWTPRAMLRSGDLRRPLEAPFIRWAQ